MTIYKVYAKTGYQKKYQNHTGTIVEMEDGTRIHGTANPVFADRSASSLANSSVYKSVKVVATDDLGTVNELIYK